MATNATTDKPNRFIDVYETAEHDDLGVLRIGEFVIPIAVFFHLLVWAFIIELVYGSWVLIASGWQDGSGYFPLMWTALGVIALGVLLLLVSYVSYLVILIIEANQKKGS